MNNHPEEVIHFILGSRGANCSALIAYDSEVAFEAGTAAIPRMLVITAAGQNSMYRAVPPIAPADCPGWQVYVVKSSIGGYTDGPAMAQEAAIAEEALGKPVRVASFGFDPDARLKRKFTFIPGSGDLPDYRFVVYSGPMAPTDLEALQRRMPHFAVADGWTQPKAYESASAGKYE